MLFLAIALLEVGKLVEPSTSYTYNLKLGLKILGFGIKLGGIGLVETPYFITSIVCDHVLYMSMHPLLMIQP